MMIGTVRLRTLYADGAFLLDVVGFPQEALLMDVVGFPQDVVGFPQGLSPS